MAASIFEMSNRTRGAYLCFSLALLLALGSYQFIVPVKQALFFDLVGVSKEPLAKTLVLLVMVPVLLLYSLAFSYVGNPQLLVLIVGGCFTGLYIFLAIVMESTHGHPGGWLAWVLYYVTECRAVILMPMIWSIVNDVTTTELAKATYPLIFFLIQLGGIGGSFVAVHVSSLGGMVGLMVLQAALLVAITGLTWAGCALSRGGDEEADLERLPFAGSPPVPAAQGGLAAQGAAGAPAGKGGAGPGMLYEAVEGLWLLVSRPYAFMTFWVSYATLMPRTVLDYTNGTLVNAAYPDRNLQVSFWGRMSLVQNCSTAALTLLGTKAIVEALGIGRALLVLPVTLACCVLAVCVHHGLWVSVVAVVSCSVMAYGLNSPCKEMLYIKTSREIKYKAKSWSEMYGNELMKLLGAQINLWINNENDACRPDCFREIPTLIIAAIWIAVWISIALRLGREHRRLEESGEIVE